MYVISTRFGNYGAEQCRLLAGMNPELKAILETNGANFTAADRDRMTGEELQKVACPFPLC